MEKEPVSAGVGWAGKNVTPRARTRPAHRLAGVCQPDAHYSSRREPHYGLGGRTFWAFCITVPSDL